MLAFYIIKVTIDRQYLEYVGWSWCIWGHYMYDKPTTFITEMFIIVCDRIRYSNDATFQNYFLFYIMWHYKLRVKQHALYTNVDRWANNTFR